MRYSGLRISDAVSLNSDRNDASGRLFLYQAKTGQPVQIPLPAHVVQTLRECEEGNPCYFWSGAWKLKSSITQWQERLKNLFVIAGISDGHGHRLRDTFAVELLHRGVPLTFIKWMPWRSGQLRMRHPQILLPLSMLPPANRHIQSIRTIPVDT